MTSTGDEGNDSIVGGETNYIPIIITDSESGIPTESDLDVDFPVPGHKFGKDVGIHIGALLRMASSVMSKDYPPQIRLWRAGSFNKVFLVTFSDGSEVVARIPFLDSAHPLRTRSEVATMSFAREHLQGIPVPRIYAWKPDHDNPVRVPYIIMEKLPGVALRESEWFKLPREKQLPILEALAGFHAQLARPVPFDKIGNIFFAPPESGTKYTTGVLLPSPKWSSEASDHPLPIEPPSADLGGLWSAIMSHEFERAYMRWHQNMDAKIIDEDEVPSEPAKTTGHFADAYRDLNVILGAYRPPSKFTSLCLWHGDIALRNVLFDMNSFTITGVLDWEDSAVLPLVLIGQYPRELIDTGGWHSCPDDWLALGTPSKWGFGGRSQAEESVEVTWARWYYSGQLARKDPRFTSTFWREAALPLKLHEVFTLGWKQWVFQQDWIRDVAIEVGKSGEVCREGAVSR